MQTKIVIQGKTNSKQGISNRYPSLANVLSILPKDSVYVHFVVHNLKKSFLFKKLTLILAKNGWLLI